MCVCVCKSTVKNVGVWSGVNMGTVNRPPRQVFEKTSSAAANFESALVMMCVYVCAKVQVIM